MKHVQTPLDRTRSALDISVTERESFRTCRRKWWIETIDNLEPNTPNMALSMGTGVHSALEALYRARARGLKPVTQRKHMAEAIAEWYESENMKMKRSEILVQGEVAEDALYEAYHLALEMLDNYLDYDKEADTPLGDVLAVEDKIFEPKVLKSLSIEKQERPPVLIEHGRLLVPIVNPDTLEAIQPFMGADRGPVMSARIDLLTLRTGAGRGLYIVDHKTTKGTPSDRGIDFADQITGYCYAVWRWLGVIPRGVIYNYLVKQTPGEPRYLANGSLSSAKDQATTPDLYRAALKAEGLMDSKGRISSEKHADCLSALLSKGWNPYFRRFTVQRNLHELLSFEKRLWYEYKDVEKVYLRPDYAYPNPSTMHCTWCSVAPICQAMEDGSDVEGIIEFGFHQGEDRKA